MSHMSTSDTSGAPGSASRADVQRAAMTAWVGWIAFAGVMMVLLGAFHIIQGLVAVFQDEYFLISSSGLVLDVDYTVPGLMSEQSIAQQGAPVAVPDLRELPDE